MTGLVECVAIPISENRVRLTRGTDCSIGEESSVSIKIHGSGWVSLDYVNPFLSSIMVIQLNTRYYVMIELIVLNTVSRLIGIVVNDIM